MPGGFVRRQGALPARVPSRAQTARDARAISRVGAVSAAAGTEMRTALGVWT